MDQLADHVADEVARTLEREMRLIRGAIALVASGGAPRVIVAGLRLGEQLLDSSSRIAREAGVRLVPLWSADEAGVDLSIEREIDDRA